MKIKKSMENVLTHVYRLLRIVTMKLKLVLQKTTSLSVLVNISFTRKSLYETKSLIWQHSYHCLPSHNQNISEILRWQCGWGVTINVNSSGINEDCKSFNKSILSNYVVNALIHSYEQISVIFRKPTSLDECISIWCTSNGKW